METKGIILSPHRIIWVQQGWLNIIEIAIRCAFLFQRIKRHDLKWRFWQLCGTTISHRSTNQYDETSTMVDRWRANVILQRQMSQDSIFMHVWRLTLVWQEQSLNLAWRPCKTVFFWNFVRVKSLTAGFIQHLIKEQAQIVVRTVEVQTVLDNSCAVFIFRVTAGSERLWEQSVRILLHDYYVLHRESQF